MHRVVLQINSCTSRSHTFLSIIVVMRMAHLVQLAGNVAACHVCLAVLALEEKHVHALDEQNNVRIAALRAVSHKKEIAVLRTSQPRAHLDWNFRQVMQHTLTHAGSRFWQHVDEKWKRLVQSKGLCIWRQHA